MRPCYQTHLLVLIFHLLSSMNWFLVEADDRVIKKTIHVGGKKDEQGFTEEEKFQDIFELTEDDFEERVMDTRDPWIVLFHTGMVDKKWKSLAVAMRGIVWFGSIHKLEQEDLVDDLKYHLKKNLPARVYPWGSQTQKKKKWQDVETPEDAKTLVIDSLPDPSSPVVVEELHNFLFEAYSTVPSRLPVIFFVKGKKLTPLFKAVALHYNNYFHFGFLQNPTPEDLALFDYNLGLPGMIILVTEDFAKEPEREMPDYDFNIISYSTEKQGSMNYPNVIKFLYGVNHQFRHTLPGRHFAEEEEIMEMEEEMEIEKLRFNVRYIDKIKEVATYSPHQVKVPTRSSGKLSVKKSTSSKGKGKKKGQQEQDKETKEDDGEEEKEKSSNEVVEETKEQKQKQGKEMKEDGEVKEKSSNDVVEETKNIPEEKYEERKRFHKIKERKRRDEL